MAMAFTYQLLESSTRNLVFQINGADASTTVAGTQNGSQAGVFNAASVTVPTTHFKIYRILWSNFNVLARLQWHATTNVDIANLADSFGDLNMGLYNAKTIAGINNNASTGVSGDIDITTTPKTALTAASGGITAAVSIILFGIKGT